MPVLRSVRIAKRFALGPYTCVVCTDCVSGGMVQYAHVVFVHQGSDPTPVLAVASEVNAGAAAGREMLALLAAQGMDPEALARNAKLVGSHVLGVFPGEGHENWGSSDEWADLESFTPRALEVVAQKFQVDASPVEVPLADGDPPLSPKRSSAPRDGRGRPERPWWRFWR
jgi:hypothetical protein